MSTLTEIEEAVETLPRREQRKLLQFLTTRLEPPVKKIRGTSAHDLMKDGCGIVNSGVGDLATNKKHMKGFGRWREKS